MSADSHDDEGIRLFREEYTDIYDFVLKLIDGKCDDKDIENLKKEYGEDFYDGVMKIIYGKADAEDIERFKEDCGEDFYDGFKKVIERKIKQSSMSYEAKPDTTGYKKGDFIGQKYEVYDVRRLKCYLCACCTRFVQS
jgi:hypothetical protein